jgi:hypothetical protein
MTNVENISNEILNTKKLSLKALFDVSSYMVKFASYTVRELLNRTGITSIKYIGGCRARIWKAQPEIGLWTFTVRCSGRRWNKGPYVVRFKLLKGMLKLKKISDMDIETSCSCNAWKYNGADYNALAGDYSEKQYSNGMPPNVKDPRRQYLICKHVAVSIPLFSKYVIPKEYKR